MYWGRGRCGCTGGEGGRCECTGGERGRCECTEWWIMNSYLLTFSENIIKFKEWKNGEGVQGALEKGKEI